MKANNGSLVKSVGSMSGRASAEAPPPPPPPPAAPWPKRGDAGPFIEVGPHGIGDDMQQSGEAGMLADAVSPALNPNLIYAGGQNNGASSGGIKSTDMGKHWTVASKGLWDTRVHSLVLADEAGEPTCTSTRWARASCTRPSRTRSTIRTRIDADSRRSHPRRRRSKREAEHGVHTILPVHNYLSQKRRRDLFRTVIDSYNDSIPSVPVCSSFQKMPVRSCIDCAAFMLRPPKRSIPVPGIELYGCASTVDGAGEDCDKTEQVNLG